MISIKHLTKSFHVQGKQVHALKDINLDVKQKEIYGIIGRSGAGKSTLIRCINRLEQPTQGQIFIDGVCISSMNAKALRHARRNMGMIFQHFNLLKSRNVLDNIALPLELAGVSKEKTWQRVHELAEITELTPFLKQFPSQLSGGQKQRVAIARALTCEPQILLSDESTSSLDPQSTLAILNLLKNINQELGITILLITHEMDVVKQICHRVGVLSRGKMVEERRVIDLFTSPQSDEARQLLQSSMQPHLPEAIAGFIQQDRTDNHGTLLRLTYQGEATSKPIIAQLIKQFDITVNILQGTIEHIQNQMLGSLIVKLSGAQHQIDAATAFLKDNQIQIEMLGYVPRD